MWGCPVNSTGENNRQMSPSGDFSRRCAFCQRQVSEDFLFCPFCGRRIGPRDAPKTRWYHSKYAIVIGLATLGPFALPMVWSNPRYRVLTKIAITVVTLAVTALLIYVLAIVCLRLVEQIRGLMNA